MLCDQQPCESWRRSEEYCEMQAEPLGAGCCNCINPHISERFRKPFPEPKQGASGIKWEWRQDLGFSIFLLLWIHYLNALFSKLHLKVLLLFSFESTVFLHGPKNHYLSWMDKECETFPTEAANFQTPASFLFTLATTWRHQKWARKSLW